MLPHFSSQLKHLRHQARLTNKELARLADVPESLVSGLQHDQRRIGELQARKLANALRITGQDLEQFVYEAINGCTEKVLNEAKPYPAQLLNLLAMQLSHAGIQASSIQTFTVAGDEFERDVTLSLHDGQRATIKTQLSRS